MKYLFNIMLFILFSLPVLSQEAVKAKVRSIEVKGSSEMEITPNEIQVGITIKEYKKGNTKIDLNTLESDLVKALRKLNIPEEDLTIEDLYGYNWNWRKRKSEEFLGSKRFILEVTDLKKMNDLIDLLDPEGINNVNIRSYSHSEMEDFRKQVKIGAMKAAKDKATYLLESVGAELGDIYEVQEIDYGYRDYNVRSNVALEAADVSGYQSNIDFKKITLRAEMRVVFEIK